MLEAISNPVFKIASWCLAEKHSLNGAFIGQPAKRLGSTIGAAEFITAPTAAYDHAGFGYSELVNRPGHFKDRKIHGDDQPADSHT